MVKVAAWAIVAWCLVGCGSGSSPGGSAGSGGGGGTSGAAGTSGSGSVTFKMDGTLISMTADDVGQSASGVFHIGATGPGQTFSLETNVLSGDVSCGIASYARIVFFAQSGMYGALGANAGTCTINISSYGAVGAHVTGTFSGMFAKGVGQGPVMVTVTDGTFDVVRGPDQSANDGGTAGTGGGGAAGTDGSVDGSVDGSADSAPSGSVSTIDGCQYMSMNTTDCGAGTPLYYECTVNPTSAAPAAGCVHPTGGANMGTRWCCPAAFCSHMPVLDAICSANYPATPRLYNCAPGTPGTSTCRAQASNGFCCAF